MTQTIARTTPYPWPWDGRLEAARTALLVVTPRRGLALGGTSQEGRVGEIAAVVSASGGTVISVVTVPPRREPDGEPLGTPAGVPADLVVESSGVDGFYGSALDAVLRGHGADQLLLTGAGLETCVHSTMRSANDRGYECLLVLDACVPYRADLAPAARSHVEMSGGIFGAVGTTTDVVAAYAALS